MIDLEKTKGIHLGCNRMASTPVSFSRTLQRWLTPATMLLAVMGFPDPAAAQDGPEPPPSVHYELIGYAFAGLDVSRIPAEKLTQIDFAFARIDPSGQVALTFPGSDECLRQLVALKGRNPALRVALSVGGWGGDGFSDAALTPESRQKFADSAVALLVRHHLDGLDIDWEYPGQPGPGIRFRPEDGEHFTALMQCLRQTLDRASEVQGRGADRHYTLSAAVAGDKAYFEHVDVKAVGAAADWLNVMTYDFRGEDSAVTGHHAQLYPSQFERRGAESADGYIQTYLDHGVSSQKLVLGAAFYGKRWQQVSAVNFGLGQPFGKFAGDLSYTALANGPLKSAEYVRHWDPDAKAPYLWSESRREFISYDDPASLREKADYAKAHALLGVMFWELGQDTDGILTSVLFDHLQ